MHSKKILTLTLGYIRLLEQQIWTTLTTHNQHRLPDEITHIIALYGDIFDEWDPSLKASFIQLDAVHNTIVHSQRSTDTTHGTAFGKLICKTGNLYQWKLKVVHITNTSRINQMTFGIAKVSGTIHGTKFTLALDAYPFDDDFMNVIAAHGMDTTQLSHGCTGSFGKKGDVITMILDLKQNRNTLEYKLNNKSYGLIYEIDTHLEYRLVVSIPSGLCIMLD
eukprot:399291_1